MSEVHITVLDQLDQLEDIVLDGSRIPFSGGRLVNEQDAIEVMDALRESLPSQITQADELIRQRDSFVEKARQQAEEIVSAARREREQLIATASIRHEAERHVAEMREQTRLQCEQMIGQARQQAAQTEQELQSRMAQLEQQFAVRRQQLEQEAQTRRQQLEAEAAERNRVLVEQHERSRQQAMQELETIRQEGLRVQRDSQVEAERLHNDALQFRQQTQQQCDALIARSRQEASTIQEGANRYAEQVLGELEGRLKELSQVVLGGRRELVRMQNPEAAANSAVVPLGDAASSLPQVEPMNRARRAAGRLRRATRGLAS
jgi:F0F1-type ATP synthase membrane subunit b/b'